MMWNIDIVFVVSLDELFNKQPSLPVIRNTLMFIGHHPNGTMDFQATVTYLSLSWSVNFTH